ncbi:MAG: AAA family ATPase [Pseudomonadota bacterium]|nr:AAA family ATPase [Pseudomonadota bacterium]
MPIPALVAEQLGWHVPEGVLEFRTTADLAPIETIIGQPNAMAALRRGVLLEGPGFNVFVVGLLSTGRLGTVKRILDELRPRRRKTRDLVYVANFKEPGRPRLLEFPPGRGVAFRKELLRVAATLVEEVPRLLRSDEVRTQRDRRTQDAEVTHHGALQRLETHARELGFLIGDLGEDGSPNPVILWVDVAGADPELPIEDAPVHTRAELQVLAEAGGVELPIPKDEVFHRFDVLERELAAALNLSREAVMETVRKVAATERDAIDAGTRKALADLGRRWPSARPWLHELHEELVESLEWFEDGAETEALFAAFTANVIHRGSRSPHAPIVVVPNATWGHLFGGIEGEAGVDHRHIRGGSLQDADGGFLVLNAADLLQDPGSWRLLKRALMFGQVDIQNPESPLNTGAAVLRPDPMQLDVKVVLLGDLETYAALFYGDTDFASIFKIKAEFEEDAACTPTLLREYSGFVAKMVRREKLAPFTRDAVGALLEWAVRAAGRGGRISTHFGSVADLLREAAFEAGGATVDRAHVEAALLTRRNRDDLAERRVIEMLQSGVLRVDLEGRRVGQVNALVVYHVGGHDFGRPMRITATVGAGRGGIVSIEREVRLSGRVHQKGVQILRGLLLDRFGRRRPLSFSASMCFEQSYSKIDGDSATTAEVYALLSALAGIPLRQDVAVTGSVNQFGEVQGVGGVNEKIEGFFTACRLRGLLGTQGVMIPHHNVPDLCLSAEVREACAQGRFHVWPVSRIEEGIELLTGLSAGERGEDREYPEDTVLGRVALALDELLALSRRRRG